MQGSIVGLFAALEGGVPKPSVQTLHIVESGCIGDQQNDTKHHGGPNRAVCLFSKKFFTLFNTKDIRSSQVQLERIFSSMEYNGPTSPAVHN